MNPCGVPGPPIKTYLPEDLSSSRGFRTTQMPRTSGFVSPTQTSPQFRLVRPTSYWISHRHLKLNTLTCQRSQAWILESPPYSTPFLYHSPHLSKWASTSWSYSGQKPEVNIDTIILPKLSVSPMDSTSRMPNAPASFHAATLLHAIAIGLSLELP